MAPRPETAIEELRSLGRYVDQALQPSLAELPGMFAALVERTRDSGVFDKVSELRQDGATDAEISQEVAHAIAPPDPDAGATVVQGVAPEQHQQVVDELAQLKAAISELKQAQSQHPQTLPAGGLSTPEQSSAEQQEIQRLQDEVQSLRIAQATAGHPTASSEPVPDAPVEPDASGTEDAG